MEMRFVDGVLDVAVTNNIVRIEFFLLHAVPGQSDADGGNPEFRRESNLSMAMPLDAFANSVSVFETVRKKLVENGTLTTVPPADPMSSSPDKPPKSSPNFGSPAVKRS